MRNRDRPKWLTIRSPLASLAFCRGSPPHLWINPSRVNIPFLPFSATQLRCKMFLASLQSYSRFYSDLINKIRGAVKETLQRNQQMNTKFWSFTYSGFENSKSNTFIRKWLKALLSEMISSFRNLQKCSKWEFIIILIKVDCTFCNQSSDWGS